MKKLIAGLLILASLSMLATSCAPKEKKEPPKTPPTTDTGGSGSGGGSTDPEGIPEGGI